MYSSWETLVLRYADGQKVCNCGDAYYDKDGRCKNGCSANIRRAREEVATKVLQELNGGEERPNV